MKWLKEGEGVPLISFEGIPGVPFLNFEEGPGAPPLNFRGIPGSWVPAPEVPGPRVLDLLLHHAKFNINECFASSK